jgi:hypothetical protein
MDNPETEPEQSACEVVGCIHLAQEMPSFCEHINELYGSTEGRTFLHQLSLYRLITKD